MGSAFDSLIVGDSITLALESRAHREGVLSDSDYFRSDFASPLAKDFGVRESVSLDYICLYDRILTRSKNFDLCRINSLAGEEVVAERPNSIRLVDLEFRLENFDFKSGLSRFEFDTLLADSDREARLLLTRNFGRYIADYRTVFDGEAGRKSSRALRLLEDSPHDAAYWVLRNNLDWLLELFACWFSHGSDSILVEFDDLQHAAAPKESRRLVERHLQTERFTSYFHALQETYFNLLESSFVGRLLGSELAYDEAPAVVGTRPTPSSAVSTIRINLADIVDAFPLPRCLEEALEFRSEPKVVAFREALNRWLVNFSSGEHLEAKLRREVQLANRDITFLRSWRNLKSRPLYFGAKSAASMVPIFGTAITLIDLVDYFLERHAMKRSAWVVSPTNRLGTIQA